MTLGCFHVDYVGIGMQPAFNEVKEYNIPQEQALSSKFQVPEEPPPKYEEPESPEINVLFSLKPNQKLRRVNNTICVETRSRLARTLSADSRTSTYEDIKRLINTAKSKDEISRIKVGVNVLINTTYKNDKKWQQKVAELFVK